MAAVEEKGVIYNRVLPPEDDPTSAMGRSWKSTYWSDDRQEVEKRLQEGGYSYEWKDDGCLRTSTKVLPAVRTDSRTGKKVYFNQMVAAYTGWKVRHRIFCALRASVSPTPCDRIHATIPKPPSLLAMEHS